jgi:hypothetical protein
MQCKVEELEVRVQDYERELSELRNQLLSRSQEAHAPSPVVGSLQSSPSYYGFLAGSPSKRQLGMLCSFFHTRDLESYAPFFVLSHCPVQRDR